MGANQSGLPCAYLDVAPRFSGAYNAFGNTFSALAGIVGPIAVALFTTKWPGMKGWRATFVLTAAQCAITLLFWFLFQTSDVIPALNEPVPLKEELPPTSANEMHEPI